MKARHITNRRIGSSLKKGLLLVFLMIATSLLTSCSLLPKEEEALAPPLKEPAIVNYDTVQVKKGTIEKVVTGIGYFVSVSQTDLYFKNRGGYLKTLAVKSGDKVKAGDLIADLDTDNLTNQIRQQELQLKKAELAYTRLKTKIDIEGGGDQLALQQASLDMDIARLQLENLRTDIEKSRLVSPVAGEVVYIDTKVNLGDFINAYKLLVRVADPTQLQLQYSDSSKISDFRLGMKVDVKVKDKVLPGEVVMTPGNAPIDADENTKKSIRIQVKDLPKDVEIGASADISLSLEKRDNVLIVPRNAIKFFAGRKYVQILEDGIRKERDIETGIETVTDSEVLKGLKEGDKVILR